MENKEEIVFKVFINRKEVGIEKLTDKGWFWRYYDLDPDKGERWTPGVMHSIKGIKRVLSTEHFCNHCGKPKRMDGNGTISGVSTRLLTRIATDLEKEMKRSDNEMVISDLEMQIDGLKALKKELDDFRTIKAILNGC